MKKIIVAAVGIILIVIYFMVFQSYVYHYNKGNELYEDGDYEGAKEEYQKSLDSVIFGRDNCQIRINKALAMIAPWDDKNLAQGNVLAAISDLEDAVIVLTEDGCADDNNTGHNKDAQTLKNEIEAYIELLKNPPQNNNGNQGNNGGQGGNGGGDQGNNGGQSGNGGGDQGNNGGQDNNGGGQGNNGGQDNNGGNQGNNGGQDNNGGGQDNNGGSQGNDPGGGDHGGGSQGNNGSGDQGNNGGQGGNTPDNNGAGGSGGSNGGSGSDSRLKDLQDLQNQGNQDRNQTIDAYGSIFGNKNYNYYNGKSW